MRTLTKVAIAIVVVGAGIGALLPAHCVDGARRDIAARSDDGNRVQLIMQGEGQKDQNLKLLLTRKVFEGGNPSNGSSAGSGNGSGGGTPSS